MLAFRDIHKSYGRTRALAGASFALRPGELHALLGENGAGKTTLMRIAYGLERPDAGIMAVDGVARQLHSPREARALGIGLVPQHPTAVPAFSVAEDIALAADWPVAPAALHRRISQLTEELGLPLDPAARAGTLPIALKQRLEIVKALSGRARVLLLDEPTAVLAPAEAAELLRVVRRFVAEGGAALLITHKLDEALAAADCITVLRRGVVTYHGANRDLTAAELARHMIGGELPDAPERVVRRRTSSPVLVHLEALEVARAGGEGLSLRGIDLELRAGQIAAVAGVEGNGQRELLRVVAGLIPPLRGVRQVARPTAFVPEDRTTEGLIPALSLAENLTLGLGGGAPWVRGKRIRLVNWPAARRRVGQLLEEFSIRAPGPDALAGQLSGGNQQKLVFARALERRPVVLIAENPTRGLDVRATAEVHHRLRAGADGGAAVLVYSSDLDEVLALGDRVLVMRDGRLHEATGQGRAEVGEVMVGGKR